MTENSRTPADMNGINNTDDTTAWVTAGDPLLQRLGAHDPVAGGELDGPESDRAQAILARVSSRPGEFSPYHQPDSRPMVDPAGADRRQPARRWPLVAAVAAAVALLIGAVATLAPSNAEPAVAAVQAAADDTAGAETGRVVTTFELDGRSEDESGTLAGAVTTEFAGDDLAVSIDIDETRSTEIPAREVAELEQARTRLVDGVLYVAPDGTQWFGIQAPAMVSDGIARLTDTRTMLDQIKTLVEVEEVGSAGVDGTDTTHYRSEIDLDDQSLAESGWLPGEGAIDVEAEGVIEIDLYVDNDGLMRRIALSGDVSPTDPTIDGAATFTVTTDFVDLGSDITIEAPEGAEMQEFGPGRFGDED